MLRPLLALSAALLLTAAGVLFFWKLDRVGLAPGLLTGSSHQVCAPRDGIVLAVKIRSGQKVAKGDELVTLDPQGPELEARSRLAALQGLEADLAEARAEIARLEKEVRPREREEAEAVLEKARLRLASAESTSTALTRLGEQSLASRLQVEQAETDRKLAAITVKDAERAIQLLSAHHGGRLGALQAEEKRLEGEIQAETLKREAAQRALADSVVRSPVEGVVTTVGLDDLPGRAVEAGDEILRVANGTPDRFEGYLSDTARAQVRSDQSVKIRLEAYPWLVYGTLRGRVVGVSERRELERGFPVQIAVEPSTAPGPLREGMRGTARIVIEEKISLVRLFLEKATNRFGT